MKTILSLLILLFLCSCQEQYFEFDKVAHYRTTVSEKQIDELYDTDDTNKKDEKLSDLIFEDYMPSQDKNFVAELRPYYFLESQIEEIEYEKIREVFTSKILGRLTATKCFPVYRDILVFKKNDIITGVSKICFNCKMDITVDSFGNKNEIDMDDFDKLEEILK